MWLPAAAAAMETIPVAAWIDINLSSILPLPALFVLLLAAIWWVRWIVSHEWPDNVGRAGTALGWIVSTLLIIRLGLYPAGAYGPLDFAWLANLGAATRWAPTLELVLVVTYIWWRGLVIGRADIEFDDLSLRFKIGLGALILRLFLALLVPIGPQASVLAQLGLFLPLYFFVSLVALSLARLARLRSTGGSNLPMNPTRTWLLALLVVSGLILVLAFAVEELVSYQTLQGLARALQPVWSALGTAYNAVGTAIAYVIFFIFGPLIPLLQGAEKRHGSPTPPRTNHLNLPQHQQPALSPTWIAVGHWLLIGLGIIIALLILWAALRRFNTFRAEASSEEREGLDAASLLRAQLRDLMARLGQRLRPRTHGETGDDLAGLPPTIRATRLLYRDLLRTTIAAGLARQAAETPDEFARRLRQQLPMVSSPTASPPGGNGNGNVSEPWPGDQGLTALTRTYTAARYSGPPPDEPTVTAIQRWWDYVRGWFHPR